MLRNHGAFLNGFWQLQRPQDMQPSMSISDTNIILIRLMTHQDTSTSTIMMALIISEFCHLKSRVGPSQFFTRMINPLLWVVRIPNVRFVADAIVPKICFVVVPDFDDAGGSV